MPHGQGLCDFGYQDPVFRLCLSLGQSQRLSQPQRLQLKGEVLGDRLRLKDDVLGDRLRLRPKGEVLEDRLRLSLKDDVPLSPLVHLPRALPVNLHEAAVPQSLFLGILI